MVQFDVFSLAAAATALLLAACLMIAYAINRSMTSFRWWAGSFLLLAVSIATATLRLDPSAMWLRWLSPSCLYAAACVVTYGLYRQGAMRNPLNRIVIGGVLLVAVTTTLTLLGASPRYWFLFGPVPTLVFLIWSAILAFRAGALFYGLALLGGIAALAVPQLSHPAGLSTLGSPLRPPPPPPPPPPPALRGTIGPGVDPGASITLDTRPPLRGLIDFPPGPVPPLEHPLMIMVITIAALVALAVTLVLRDVMAEFARMRHRSSTDAMTGLLNRVTFEETATALLAAATAPPICAILFDIDKFKQINDTAGHAAGDRVISLLGHLLLDMAGPGYAAGRVGGEEFAVILGGSDLAAARRFAESVRTRFATAEFGDDIGWRVTVSAGIAAFRPGDTLHDLMGRSDKALYLAKAAGRDRVAMAPELAAEQPWPAPGAGVAASA